MPVCLYAHCLHCQTAGPEAASNSFCIQESVAAPFAQSLQTTVLYLSSLTLSYDQPLPYPLPCGQPLSYTLCNRSRMLPVCYSYV